LVDDLNDAGRTPNRRYRAYNILVDRAESLGLLRFDEITAISTDLRNKTFSRANFTAALRLVVSDLRADYEVHNDPATVAITQAADGTIETLEVSGRPGKSTPFSLGLGTAP